MLVPSVDPSANGSTPDPFDATAGGAQRSAGISVITLFASVIGASVLFCIEFGIFLLLKTRFSRIYQPRTYLVPERERTKAPPTGYWEWIVPVFRTSNSDFIQKCGLDAYFFLRYLRTLLKIFVPLSIVILPILIPLNVVDGRGLKFAKDMNSNHHTLYGNVTGLDQLAWVNVRPENNNRYWAHLVLAVLVVVYTCYIFFDELKGYIRLRQAYLTSPQHRLRASATTVLVSGIPRKWCTFEALDGLYDVFPGGVRNIWVNRNFDELHEKVKLRNKIADRLEVAETTLIRNVKKAHIKKFGPEPTDAKIDIQVKDKNRVPKAVTLDLKKRAEDRAVAMAEAPGVSAGDPHQVHHTLDDALSGLSGHSSRDQSPTRKKSLVPMPTLGQGIEAVGHGIDNIGKTVLKGLKQVGKNVDGRVNKTGGSSHDRKSDGNDNDVAPDGLGIEDANTSKTQRLDDASNKNIKLVEEDVEDRLKTTEELAYDRQGDITDKNVASNGLNIANVDKEKTRHPYDASNNGTLDRDVPLVGGAHVSPQQTEKLELPSQDGQHHFGTDGWYDDSRADHRLAQSHKTVGLNDAKKQRGSGSKLWKFHRRDPFGIPSPTPHSKEEDEFPLGRQSPIAQGIDTEATSPVGGSQKEVNVGRSGSKKSQTSDLGKRSKNIDGYPAAYNENYDPNDDGEPAWKRYIKEKDRETTRLPIFGWQWMPSLPLLGEKVDTIDHCRKELARLNVEIEQDQREPEKFPLMNSAFVQFNHQVAAHMACQAVSHHTPNNMAPRVVEISPDDVVWDNMSIKWWESYVRTGVVIILIGGLIIGWAFPVTFTGLLSQVDYLADTYRWLAWLKRAPPWVLSIIQGLLPQLLLAGLLALLPFILRFLSRSQGDRTGMEIELSVQNYFFAFLFVQVFLVVSISSGITTVLSEISQGLQNVPSILASNLPKSSNYFFSYLILQALTVSAGALVQVEGLLVWFIFAPLHDNTARQKWSRQTNLPDIGWGTFFPVFTNLAAIGLIYSVISPLIMVFNIISFGLFWLVYRYNTLYVTKFRFDTGGLLYPRAINQLFTGLYVMELCLIGLFFLVRDVDKNGNAVGTPCKGQAITMVVVFMFTLLYQILLNKAFSPLFRYLPITLEDEAVIRDEEFARAQEKRFNLDENESEGDDINDVLAERARRSEEESRKAEDVELEQIHVRKERSRLDPRNLGSIVPDAIGNLIPSKPSWAERSRNKQASNSTNPDSVKPLSSHRSHRPHRHRHSTDPEAQNSGTDTNSSDLFSGINDEIEDLTPDERDKLVQRAFQHEALRAKRPVIWIPRDELGVSDDEIRRTQKFSKHIWISNDYTGLDGKCRVIYRRSPPDFDQVDLIEL